MLAVDNLPHKKYDLKASSQRTLMSIRIKKDFVANLAVTVITLVTLMGLSACDEGGSSSGSDDDNNFAGTFEGGGDTKFTIGGKTVNDYAPTKVIIRPQGKVEISDGSPNISTRGIVNSDEFETSGRLLFNNNGVACDISIVYTATITLDNGIAIATGNVSGKGQCNNEPASVEGEYSASKISDIAKSPVNSGFEEKFRSLY